MYNSAPKANEISADLDVSNIITGKRIRKLSYNTSAAVHVNNENKGFFSGQPFLWCLVNEINTDKLEKTFTSKFNNAQSCDQFVKDPKSWKKMQNHPNRTHFTSAAEEEIKNFKIERLRM